MKALQFPDGTVNIFVSEAHTGEIAHLRYNSASGTISLFRTIKAALMLPVEIDLSVEEVVEKGVDYRIWVADRALKALVCLGSDGVERFRLTDYQIGANSYKMSNITRLYVGYPNLLGFIDANRNSFVTMYVVNLEGSPYSILLSDNKFEPPSNLSDLGVGFGFEQNFYVVDKGLEMLHSFGQTGAYLGSYSQFSSSHAINPQHFSGIAGEPLFSSPSSILFTPYIFNNELSGYLDFYVMNAWQPSSGAVRFIPGADILSLSFQELDGMLRFSYDLTNAGSVDAKIFNLQGDVVHTFHASPNLFESGHWSDAVGVTQIPYGSYYFKISCTPFYNTGYGDYAQDPIEMIYYFDTLPGVPSLSSPGNGTGNLTTAPVLAWIPAVHSSSNQVQVSLSPSFAAPVFDQSGITGQSVPVPILVTNTTYYWRVRGYNSGGYGSWSEVRTFTTGPLVDQNTTWNGTAYVSQTARVVNGATLTIGAGSNISFATGASITVTSGSKLIVNGSTSQRVLLTRSSGTWAGVNLTGANGSSINGCDIRYATSPLVVNSTTSLVLNDVVIQNSSFQSYPHDAAIAVYASTPTMSGVKIYGQSDSWNGIRFASGSGGVFAEGEIANCGRGNGVVIQGGSYPQISSSYIHHNYYHGIVIPQNGTAVPRINGNMISYNGPSNYVGVIFDYSDGFLQSNTITNSAGGLYAYNYSSITSGGYGSMNGNNLITANNLGLFAYNYSDATFGDVDTYHGVPSFYGACNKIFNNAGYEAAVNTQSWILAEGNWWGSSPPSAGTFSIYNGGWIEYGYYRQDPDEECGLLARVVTETEFGSAEKAQPQVPQIRSAQILYGRKDFGKASQLYNRLLDDPTSTDAVKSMALVGLLHSEARAEAGFLVEARLQQYANKGGELGNVAGDLLPIYLAQNGKATEASKSLTTAISIEQNEARKVRQLFQLASLVFYDKNLLEVSKAALQELGKKDATLVDQGLLAAFGGQDGVPSPNMPGPRLESDLADLTVFPNPFNPSTEIRYSVTEPGSIRLEIFDILGRSVEVLAEDAKSVGIHSATWNGDRFPSGMYLLRFAAGGKATVKKLMLAK
jgi:hypothetical protein